MSVWWCVYQSVTRRYSTSGFTVIHGNSRNNELIGVMSGILRNQHSDVTRHHGLGMSQDKYLSYLYVCRLNSKMLTQSALERAWRRVAWPCHPLTWDIPLKVKHRYERETAGPCCQRFAPFNQIPEQIWQTCCQVVYYQLRNCATNCAGDFVCQDVVTSQFRLANNHSPPFVALHHLASKVSSCTSRRSRR